MYISNRYVWLFFYKECSIKRKREYIGFCRKGEGYYMNEMTSTQKKLSCVLKVIVILSAFIGTGISAYGDRNVFFCGLNIFMYFTNQSNIVIAVICAVGLYLIVKNKKISELHYIVKYVGTVAITLTGVVFIAVLAPASGPEAWDLHNVLAHIVVPIASIADFFVIIPGVKFKKKDVLYVIIPPLIYVIYAGIGYVRGWDFYEGNTYPYFFLNWGSPAGAFGFIKESPFMGCVWWILALLIFLIIMGYVYLVIVDHMGKKSK